MKIAPNTGSVFFSSSELSQMNTGVVAVEIFDGNVDFKPLPSGKMAFFAVYSAYTVEIKLTD